VIQGGISPLIADFANHPEWNCQIVLKAMEHPEHYGVARLNDKGRVVQLIEKPKAPPSNLALVGIYMFDHHIFEATDAIKPSARGELEITDVNAVYLQRGQLHVETMGRGYAWLDTGTPDSLHDASSFVATLEKRQGFRIACPEEIAWRMGFISAEDLTQLGEKLGKSDYGRYLLALVEQEG
jgi:glucose-1-phosphate thymidylyltransferase